MATRYQAAGQRAFQRGQGMDDCPYEGLARLHWRMGWANASAAPAAGADPDFERAALDALAADARKREGSDVGVEEAACERASGHEA
jgi:hypothetical protein